MFEQNKIVNTKEYILEVSYELFSTRGYDKTPISLILEKTGLSKGGFYHHFKSKEEIIDHIAKTQVDVVVSILDQIANQSELSAIEKFNQLMEKVQLYRTQNKEQLFKLYERYLKPENLYLKEKIDAYTIEKAISPYSRIVRQGIEENVFHTSAPELAIETIIRIAPVLRMKMVRLYLQKEDNNNYREEIEMVADYLEEFILKILGAKQGSLIISAHVKSYFLNI